MATLPVIDNLDRCKIALQYVAEMQPDRLTNVFDLLLERLDAAIGQAHAQLRQCQCLDHSHPRVTPFPVPRGVLTVLPGCRQPQQSPAPQCPEGLPTGGEHQWPDESHTQEGA
jgi:hypothetical protein